MRIYMVTLSGVSHSVRALRLDRRLDRFKGVWRCQDDRKEAILMVVDKTVILVEKRWCLMRKLLEMGTRNSYLAQTYLRISINW